MLTKFIVDGVIEEKRPIETFKIRDEDRVKMDVVVSASSGDVFVATAYSEYVMADLARLAAGAPVLMSIELKSRPYTRRDGNGKGYWTSLVATHVQAKTDAGTPARPAPRPAPAGADERPEIPSRHIAIPDGMDDDGLPF